MVTTFDNYEAHELDVQYTLLSAERSDVNLGIFLGVPVEPILPLPMKALSHMFPHVLARPSTQCEKLTPRNLAA